MSSRVEKYGEKIPQEKRSLISQRYKTVTQAINSEFWELSSDSEHSRYVGSYGRKTAINTSDIDILVEIPNDQFDRFSTVTGNGPSRFLQAIRDAILDVYPRSDVRADGQVVKIAFSDGMDFEILPAFKTANGTFRYPDSNMGGNWRSTNPVAEIEAMLKKNAESNGLLCDTCRHIRLIRDSKFSSYKLSGIAIDSFVHGAMGNWRWTPPGETGYHNGEYEQALYSYLIAHTGDYLIAPGSGDVVKLDSEQKDCLRKVLEEMI